MNVYRQDINCPTYRTDVTIIPIEPHISRRKKSNGFCRSTWNRLLSRVEKDPNCRVVVVGDLRDVDRPSTRERRLIMGLGRPEVLDEDDMQDMDEVDNHILPDLKRIKDKIIGMVDGDHYRVYSTGKTSTQYICEKLKIPGAYLGQRMGWIRLCFCHNRSKILYDIFVRHGKGSSSTAGSDMNALVRQSVGFDAHLYLAGHTHRQWFHKVPYLYVGKNDIKERFVAYARAGSLLRGFLFGETTYAEEAEYSPLSIGWPEITLTIRADRGNNGNICVSEIRGTT